jgi:hypothetical protein
MELFESLESGAIRFSEGKTFNANGREGSAFLVDSLEEAKVRAQACAERNGYAGAEFVCSGAEVPEAALLFSGWATPVELGKIIGAIVEWTTTEKEVTFRGSRPKPLSFEDFNAARHGE